MATAAPNLVQEKKISKQLPLRLAAAATKISCQFLSESEDEDWDRFVDRSPNGTVFHYSWWLRRASSALQLLVVRDDRGQIVGGLPLPQKRVAGFRLLHSPALAPYLGPVFDIPTAESEGTRLQMVRSYSEALGKGIGGFDSYRCIAGASAPDLQGFLWAGFRVSLGYTFRFSASQSIQEITKGITRTHMQKLNKAKRLNLRVVRDEGLETLLDLNKMTFTRQGAAPPYSDATVKDLWKAASARQRANVYLATTPEGDPVAGLLTVNDTRTTFQIISGFNSAFMDVPGQNLVLWSALQDALNAGRDFDFEGSEMRGVEAFYRRWGALAVPVWRIEKAGSLGGRFAQVAIRYKDAKRLERATRRKLEGK